MGIILHLTSVILIILWAIGLFAFSVGLGIHSILIVAFIAFLLGNIQQNSENL